MTNAKVFFEPGILKTFRNFTGVRLALAILSVGAFWTTHGQTMSVDIKLLVFGVIDSGLLLIYLSLPHLPSLLKRTYLPVGLVWAAVGPLLQMYLSILFPINEAQLRTAALLVLQPILVLFIPLVLIAWQYSSREVWLFCGLTYLSDLLMSWVAYRVLGLGITPALIALSITRTALSLLVGNMIVNLMRVQREQRQRLTEANDRLAQYAATLEQLTTSRERNRMARELHDVLAHTMSGVAVELEGVRTMLRVDPDQAESLLGQSLQAVRDGLTETRRALQALRAAPIEDLGLGLAVRNLAESIAGRAGLAVTLQIEGDFQDYSVEVQQCFYRVAQEALTNVANHAMARQVLVSLQREQGELKLQIADDGVGFDQNRVDLSQRYGLLGMHERVEMIHGHLSVQSQDGAGTQIMLVYGGAR